MGTSDAIIAQTRRDRRDRDDVAVAVLANHLRFGDLAGFTNIQVERISPMSLHARDEFPHTAPSDAAIVNWQEIYCFRGWDEKQKGGFHLSINRVGGSVEVAAVVFFRDRHVSTRLVHPTDPGTLDLAGLVLDVTNPFRGWKISLTGQGSTTRFPFGFLASGPTVPPNTAMRMEVTLVTGLEVVDFQPTLDEMSGAHEHLPGEQHEHGPETAAHDHNHARVALGAYEQGHEWSGRLILGADEFECVGLSTMYHSWGPQDVHGIKREWWTAACLDGARAFFSCSTVEEWEGGPQHWFGAILDGDDLTWLSGAEIAVTQGLQEAENYGGVATAAGRTPGHRDIHLLQGVEFHAPIAYRNWGTPWLVNEGFGTASLDLGGRIVHGSGVAELARPLYDEEIAALGWDVLPDNIASAYQLDRLLPQQVVALSTKSGLSSPSTSEPAGLSRLESIQEIFREANKEDRVRLLLEYSRKLPPLPPELAASAEKMERVVECVTPFFLKTEIGDDDRVILHFGVPQDAPSTRAFAAIFWAGLNGARSEEVLRTPDDFYLSMGLQDIVFVIRLQSIGAILRRLKRQVRELNVERRMWTLD